MLEGRKKEKPAEKQQKDYEKSGEQYVSRYKEEPEVCCFLHQFFLCISFDTSSFLQMPLPSSSARNTHILSVKQEWDSRASLAWK